MGIKVLVTGGTIDDLDYSSHEQAPKAHRSLIPRLLKQARITADYSVDVLMQKDSRVVTDTGRAIILKKCLESKEDKIIITHGTSTMPLTAKFLLRQKTQKTIVLFGSAIPANKENSDALFNLGLAFAAVQLLPPGVYIAMNGNVFPADNVKKNFEKGVFEREKT